MSHNLYQFRSQFPMTPGSYCIINGPHDTHGVVIKSEHKPVDNDKREYLNLIRGTGHGDQQ